jgi:putative ABC transport system substrate-binding protein
LLSYGPNTVEIMRRVAVYVDKILKGGRPADIPFERPARFELVVNLRTAKASNLAIPSTLLARADEVTNNLATFRFLHKADPCEKECAFSVEDQT